MSNLNSIPPMTDPLGRHWDQPSDIREAPMDDTHVLLSSKQVAGLKEYSTSVPSGTYDGKCWKRKQGDDMFLCWYEPCNTPGQIGIGYRIIIEVD